MTGPNEIAEVCGIFHDGWISEGTKTGGTADILVEIEYLAERIRPDFRRFTIRLEGVTELRFAPWTDEGAPLVPDITDFPEIARLELGLLSAETVNSIVRVACTQDRPGLGYSGGFLDMALEGCRVFDEAGREWTLDELRKLSDGYWSDWALRNKNAQQGGGGQPATRPQSK